jgi:hypothetical protein
MDTPVFASGRVTDSGNVQHADDKALIVEFYLHSVRQGFESDKAGRDIFREEPYVWIRFAGDRTREIRRPIIEFDKERFERQWLAFERQQAVVHEGTPLEAWASVSKTTALNLKSLNIHTVEQLASVNDGLLMNLGTGATDLREKARVWLKAAADSATTMHLESELKKRDDDIAMLRKQIEELSTKRSKKD